MATQQDKGGVPFSIAHEMLHFRLLELPPEVAELIERPNPPPLSIKSLAPSAPSNASHAKPAYAVLCTPNKTFQLRQVQTSNSLFVTQPMLETHGNDIPVPETCAIAACTATLELHPSAAPAVTLLRDALPVYDLVAGDVDAPSNGKSKLSVFEDLPMSDGECQTAWDNIMAFELDDSSYQPSPNALTQVWRSINGAALAEGVKLDSQFLTLDITDAVAEEGHPPGLVKAILAYLSTEGTDREGAWSSLDRKRTVHFTGRMLLEAKRGADFLIADFTDTWEDRLPEAWRKDAQLSAIEGVYEFPTETTIRTRAGQGSNDGSRDTTAKPSARKWHEKFNKTRKK
ncbi:hypothetical protein IAQ61_003880 [Plenodomus lingam]|uniref:Similar to sister chromatid cohesion protein Dcc1 n=1 Tax=Leptosphaeria maculans (strain JN3 / isolate v23.1.3 / race Av1-4-5-6-7-8) TaxID=985895 RepID=E4ZQK1_LEPMJ|nr:similar to sister chromatid cohesion protein Dcc1 [Plenodomus lingam JN3]KAH9874690.1 hypothetical protein IAQ61_003880 [Plenodomus lingam]CBX94006.1 similar to sister chromatid cohesion protein Dcc1 [Plenodomus lingam JN3]